MPEGFNSVADLKIIVDANADKFATSVKGVLQSLGDLDEHGNKSLSGFDKALAMVGEASIGVTGKFKLLAAGVEAGVAIYQQFAREGRAVAEALGAGEQFDELTASLADLGMTIKDTVVGAFFAMEGASVDAASGMITLSGHIDTSDSSAKNFAQTLLERVTQAINSVRMELKLLNGELGNTPDDVNKNIEHVNRRVGELQKLIADIESGAVEATRAIPTRAGMKVIDLLGDAQRELNSLLALNDKLVDRFNETTAAFTEWSSVTSTETNAAKLLRDEVDAIEEKTRRMRMGAVELARYTAEQKALRDLEEARLAMTPEIRASLDAQLAQVEALTRQQEALTQAKRDAERAEPQAQQRERAQGQIFANAERELSTLKARADAVGLNARETAELVMYERLLAQLRSSGGPYGEAELVKIRAIAAEYGRSTEALATQQDELRKTGEVGQAMAGGLSSAFAKFTSGAKVDFGDMAKSILADLAQIAMRKNILEPLFGGGSGGGSGIFGALMSGLGGMFGGARADGGDVEPGRAYLVGERGPEMFMPRTAGSIAPNGARAGGDVHIYVHGTPEFDARVESTAEGVVVRSAPGIISQAERGIERKMPAWAGKYGKTGGFS